MAYEVSISGAALASLLHLCSSSPSSASSGLLCGITSSPSPSSPPLSDFDPSPTPNASPSLFITRLFSFPHPLSFFSPQGHLHSAFLHSHFPSPLPPLLGWFSFRRASSLRPSMRDLAVSLSLSQTLTPSNTPCLFLLLSSSLSPNRAVHTHDYRAFLLLTSTSQMPVLQPVSLHVLNVGAASSGSHYGSFSPHFSPLPAIPCALPPLHHPHSMLICDEGDQIKKSNADQSLLLMKQKAQHQKVLDESTEGFEVDRLEKLVGGSASAYTQEIEELYASMLRKLQSLTHQLEKTSALVFEQENRNLELRCRLAGME